MKKTMQRTPAQLKYDSDLASLEAKLKRKEEKITELRDKLELADQRQISYMRALHLIFLNPQDDDQFAILVREISRDDKINYIFLKDFPK